MPSRQQRLRISIVCRDLATGAGGMERTAANLASHMARQGHATAIAYRDRSGDKPLYPIDEAVVETPYEASTESLLSTIEQFHPDVIVFFYATANEAVHIVALCETNIPVVLHEGSNPERVINNNWAVAKGISPDAARLERLATLSGCARIRFTLPQYRDSLPPSLRDDSVSFPNAFAPANPADVALRSEQGRKIFLNIGGLKKVKNVLGAIHAFALIADELPDWDFHIFSAGGKRNPVRPQVDALIAAHGLENRIKMFPPTAAIGREYGRSHVHVIASKEEGLPKCIAEASRHGLPSIGFACCAGTNSMIVSEHNGLLVDCGPDETQALAEAMLRTASDAKTRKRWGSTAKRESKIYDPKCIFAAWEKLIREAARDKVTMQGRMQQRFGNSKEFRRLRAVQRASLNASPWPAPSATPFDTDLPSVSIIIPLFNKEEYIEETLTSIVACTYPNIEVIIVDDCSTDKSAHIATKFCDQYKWTLIQHTHNGGLSAARNTGLHAAKGTYVHFWDADDIYAPDGVGRILQKMHDDESDIATGVATRDGKVIPRYLPAMRDLPSINYAQNPESFANASACFKIYRRAFLIENELEFEPQLYMQDSAFNMNAFPLAERITMTSDALGDYRQVEGSGSRQFHAGRFKSALDVDDVTRTFYADYGLHGLDPRRQDHVIGLVLSPFLRRAQQGYGLINANTQADDLDFDFLGQISRRLPALTEGLLRTKDLNNRQRLSFFAIRAGYLNWLPELLCGKLPNSFRTDLVAESPIEKQIIDATVQKMTGI